MTPLDLTPWLALPEPVRVRADGMLREARLSYLADALRGRPAGWRARPAHERALVLRLLRGVDHSVYRAMYQSLTGNRHPVRLTGPVRRPAPVELTSHARSIVDAWETWHSCPVAWQSVSPGDRPRLRRYVDAGLFVRHEGIVSRGRLTLDTLFGRYASQANASAAILREGPWTVRCSNVRVINDRDGALTISTQVMIVLGMVEYEPETRTVTLVTEEVP